MIQLSNLLSMNPETPAKTVGAGAADSGFANVLSGELETDPAAGGKTLPGALPVRGKTLPVAFSVANSPEAAGEPPVDAEATVNPDEAAGKAAPIGPIVIPSIRLAAASQQPLMADQADGEPKNEAPRAETLPLAAAKAIAVELKARVRPERPVMDESAEKPVDAEASDAEGAEVHAGADADALTLLPVIVAEVPVELPATLPAAEPVRPETDRGNARMQAPVQTVMSDQTAEARETMSAKDGARQGTERDSSAQGEGTRGQRGAPELRFELSRAGSDSRVDRAASASVNQLRMPLAAASQIVLPEAATISGQVADASGLPGATNTASASFASQQGMRPHDFATLVDRLVEARETARGGAVNVAVMHAEFGEVSLRFRQDAGGLSVSMSNSDPEFARAISAASQADGSQMGDNSGQGGRRDDGTQSGSTFSRAGTGGDWGQSSADANLNGGDRQNMRDDAGDDRIDGQMRVTADEDRSGRDGIYA